VSDTPHQRRSAWPLIVGFAVLAVLIAAAGYWAWLQQSRSMQRQAERSLVAVGELKAGQITSWRGERQADAEMIHGDPLLSTAVEDMLAGRDAGGATTSVQTYLDNYQRNYGYKDVVLTSPKGAVLLRSPSTASDTLSGTTKALVAKAAATGRVESSDLYQDAEGNALLDLVAPVSVADGGVIATVILRSDLDSVLYPLIQRWPLPSKSGETLLVERRGDRVVYLNELRHRKNTAFKLTAPLNMPDRPASMAVRGRRGVYQGVDYRGVPVLSAIQPVPGTPWFIVAKEDTGEVLGAIRTRGWLTAGFTLLLVLLAGAGTLFVWRSRESQVSAEIRESEQKYRMLIENLSAGVVVHAPDTRILLSNLRAGELLGLSADQMQGKTAMDSHWRFLSDDAQPLPLERYPVNQILASGEALTEFVIGVCRSEHAAPTWLLCNGYPERDEHGELVQIVITFVDITERKQAEEALQESQDLLTQAEKLGRVGGWEFDIETQTQTWTETVYDIHELDITSQPTVGQGENYYTPASRPIIERAVQRAIEQGEPFDVELEIITAKGNLRSVHSVGQADLARRKVSGFIQDVTERKRAEEALRAASLHSRNLIETSLDPLVTISAAGKITDVNTATEKVTGKSRETLIDSDFANYFTDPEMARAGYQKAFSAGQVIDYPLAIRHSSGAITEVLYNASVYRDEHGEVLGVFAAARDVTERKQAEDEIRRLNAELEQRVLDRTAQLNATNKELEAFAYSVSHDLRAPLRHISGFSELLAARSAAVLDDRGRHYLETITTSVREMGMLIDDLLQFSRTGRTELQIAEVDMEAALREALEPLRRETEGREIEWSIGALPRVVGDHALLRQVWANLLSNALKYSRGRTPARIEVGARDGDGASEDVFWVRDNGVGFDMQYAHKLFGVFQRLHSSAEFEGTGIGLANVQRIIDRLAGRVWAEAELDQGATFYFSLPRRKETPS